jgi:hypothetical protein
MTTRTETTNAPAFGAHGIDWNNVDLTREGFERSRNLIENLTFDALLLEIHCNLPSITAQTVTAQFETDLASRITEAREIFAANLANIVRQCRKERACRVNAPTMTDDLN